MTDYTLQNMHRHPIGNLVHLRKLCYWGTVVPDTSLSCSGFYQYTYHSHIKFCCAFTELIQVATAVL